MDLPKDLPVTGSLSPLRAVLDAGRNAVLVAPPGAGKTTLVPLALLDAPWRGNGRILVLEPRRLAARAAAARMSALVGEKLGATIGFRTRLDSAVSSATRIEVITEGLLVARLHSDPGLAGVAAVIFDEVHERSLDGDLALALCLELQRELRPELRLLAMSATADQTRLPALMNAAVIESAGRMFAVEIRHAKRDIATTRDLPDAMARAVRDALAEPDGDILAFLPGMAEIRRTEAGLANCGALVLPLHGDLAPAAQDRALTPAAGRRVVLATSIAETSLTVPGVRIVIDGGWRRSPRLDPATGLSRLATLRISRAAAAQRAGRAGREAPGVAIRLWSVAAHRGLAEFDRPEMLEAELSGLVLHCAAWGTPPADLAFLDAPPAGALAAAQALLFDLGALDAAGRITERGQAMALLGSHPRLAAMMLAAATPAEAATAADLAALLEERDPMRDKDAGSDVGLRLAAIGSAAGADEAVGEIERGAVSRIRRAAGQYRRRLRLTSDATDGAATGKLLAAAFPDRIAQRRGEPGSFRLSGGGGARLPPDDRLAKQGLLVVAAIDLKLGARIRLAAPLDPDNLPATLLARTREAVESGLDVASGAVFSRRRVRLGALVLSDRTERADPAQAADGLAQAIAAGGLKALPWTDSARNFQARVAWMRGIEPELWPDLSDAALTADRAWLAPHLIGMTRLAALASLELTKILRGALDYAAARRLDAELPDHLALPGGRAPIDYTAAVPTAAARAQTFFGMAETPRLAQGRVPLLLALLSPARRPIAVTGDLAGFWAGGWADARRDMRGRYPKHDWPENPARRSPS